MNSTLELTERRRRHILKERLFEECTQPLRREMFVLRSIYERPVMVVPVNREEIPCVEVLLANAKRMDVITGMPDDARMLYEGYAKAIEQIRENIFRDEDHP